MTARAARFLLLGVAAAWGFQSRAQSSLAPDDDPIIYVVRDGDNLYNLAERYLNRVPDYRLVQRINHIRDPYRIPVGTRLRIPDRVLRKLRLTAEVVSARGQTLVVTPRGQKKLKTGDRVSEGDRVVTGPNSFVTLRVEDGTLVNFPSRSICVVKMLRRTLMTGRVARLFWLEEGRASAGVKPLRDGHDFRIETPVSVSAVRGTQYRVRFDKFEHRARTEVLEGTVSVAGSPGKYAEPLSRGYGITVDAGGSGRVAALPLPPKITSIAYNASGTISLGLDPIPGAAGYHALVASDELFVDTIAEAWSDKSEFLTVPAGSAAKFVRISAIDSNGLEGLWTAAPLPPADSGPNIRIMGSGRFGPHARNSQNLRMQIVRDTPDGPVVIDRRGSSIEEVAVTGLARGIYYWRVIDDADPSRGWSPPIRFVITREE